VLDCRPDDGTVLLGLPPPSQSGQEEHSGNPYARTQSPDGPEGAVVIGKDNMGVDGQGPPSSRPKGPGERRKKRRPEVELLSDP
jgi:hypothetical protein